MDTHPINHSANLITECIAQMHENGILLDGCLKPDGELHRFSRDSKKSQPDEWYRCHQNISSKGNLYIVCYYGTWSGGQDTFVYNSYETNRWISQEELAEIHAKEEQRKKQLDQELHEEKKRRIEKAQETWDQAIQNPTTKGHTSYLERKQVNPYGIKYRVDYQGIPAIVIPLRSINGQLQAVQCIQEDGTKRIYGAKKGNFHVIGEIKAQSQIFIAEGYATGASIHQATNSPVVVAFDCGNLKSVVHNLREKYPQAKLVIAADDDRETQGNPGKTKAEEAAKACGCDVIIPIFPEGFTSPSNECLTDFNDLHVHFGLDKVTNQLKQAPQFEEQTKNSESSITQVPPRGFQFRSAHALTQEPPKANWLIKSYIDACSLVQLFGEPGSMKSFLAIDMGLCVASGQSWHRSPIRKKGLVFYIAGEGFAGLSKRLKAWSLANNIDLKEIPFFVSDRPAQMLDPSNVKEVIEAIEELKRQHGLPVFVIIDTLNRNFGPGDENKTEDMTKFVNCVDTNIRLKYGCAVLIVHHSPLNDSGRARGNSSLRGALDWEYCLTKHGDARKLSTTKVKDYEPPPNVIFKPRSIFLDGWIDEEDGEIISSCVLEKVDGDALESKSNIVKLKGPQKIAFDCLLKLFESDIYNQSEGVHVDTWREAAYTASISPAGTLEANRKAFQRAIKDLRNDGYIEAQNNYWKPCRTWDRDGTNKGHVPNKDEGQTGHVSLDMSRCPARAMSISNKT